MQAADFIDESPKTQRDLPKPLEKKPGAEISNELADFLLRHPRNGAIWLVPSHLISISKGQ